MTATSGLALTPATAADRQRIMRVRPAAAQAFFVHYNWFWLDRSLRDPAVHFKLVRAAPRGGLVAVVAYGPYDARDQDPTSRVPGSSEIYHLVVDHKRAGQGLGRQITEAVINPVSYTHLTLPTIYSV